MKTKEIDRLISGACEDQRADLEIFAETGDQDALARVHFDSCAACDDIVDKMIGLRDGLPPAPAIVTMPKPAASRGMKVFVAVCLAWAAAVAGFTVYLIVQPFFQESAETLSEAARLESRIRYVPMPGFPGTCVAGVQGTGGYGPTYFGAAPCKEVRERFDADEGLTFGLRDYAVVRIRGTRSCLAHAPDHEHDFTFVCAPSD